MAGRIVSAISAMSYVLIIIIIIIITIRIKKVREQGTWEISNLSFRAAIGPLTTRPRGGASSSYVQLVM